MKGKELIWIRRTLCLILALSMIAVFMFCSDDKHPSDLLELGHMDYVIRRAVKAGADPIIAVKAATYNTARYFGLRGIGAIAPGCKADMVAVDDLENFRVEQVWKNGTVVFDGAGLIPIKAPAIDPSLDAAAHATFSSMRALDTPALSELNASCHRP